MTVTFFGHKETPEDIYEKLRARIAKFVVQNESTVFYVGNQGSFDQMVRKALRVFLPFLVDSKGKMCYNISRNKIFKRDPERSARFKIYALARATDSVGPRSCALSGEFLRVCRNFFCAQGGRKGARYATHADQQ